MLAAVAAILGFLALAGLGFVLTGDDGAARMAKRTQMVAGAPAARLSKAAPAGQTAEARRKQILKTLQDQDKKQKKAAVTLSARLHQAGLTWTPTRFWIVSGVVGLTVAVLMFVVTQKPALALGAAFSAAFGLPRWVIGFLAKRRMGKFTSAFADAMDVIVRGIRSGLPVHDCLRVIGEESPEPLAGEFRRLTENLAVGMTMDQALGKMYEHMPTSELRFFAIVLAIQQKAGGNLAEALNNLSTVLRARKMMREKIKALSAEATASAAIIGCLPPGVTLLITITSPAYMAPMFQDPRGQMLLLGGVIWMSVGVFVMRKMINFKF